MALTVTDRLLGGYFAFVTVVVFTRGMFPGAAAWAILAFHALFAIMLWLFTRLKPGDRLGAALHTVYPLVMLIPTYWEFGLINGVIPRENILAHDVVVQQWEAALFGRQVSYEWIRRYPSVLWSGVLHASYLSYYVILSLGPVMLVLRGRRASAQDVLYRTMLAFVPCYLAFLVYPVAGPYYAFDQPTGAIREVWTAELVYGMLATSSSIGAAFPSSHVAASVAATLALRPHWPGLALALAPFTVLLTIGTVYCQMHYGIDALTGMLVGVAAVAIRGTGSSRATGGRGTSGPSASG